MNRLLPPLDRALQWALVLLVAGMVLSVTWQIVSRFLLTLFPEQSFWNSWTEEAARFLLIWIGMLGGAWAFRRRVHIGLDLLPQKLTGSRARALDLFTRGAIILFALAVLVVGGSKLVLLTWELRQYSPVLGLPIAFVYSVIPLAGVLIVIFSLAAAPVDDEPDFAETTHDDEVAPGTL